MDAEYRVTETRAVGERSRRDRGCVMRYVWKFLCMCLGHRPARYLGRAGDGLYEFECAYCEERYTWRS
jgi:hypothetical protein